MVCNSYDGLEPADSRFGATLTACWCNGVGTTIHACRESRDRRARIVVYFGGWSFSCAVEKIQCTYAQSRARLEIGAASFRSLGYFCSYRGQARYAAARVEEQKRDVMSADQLAHFLKNFRTVKVSDKEESLSRSARRLLHGSGFKWRSNEKPGKPSDHPDMIAIRTWVANASETHGINRRLICNFGSICPHERLICMKLSET